MKKIISVIVVILICSCKKEYPEPVDKKMFGTYTSMSLETRYVSHSGNELFLESDVGFIYDGHGFDDLDVPDSVFHDDVFSNHTLTVDTIESISNYENKSYSNLILLDESPWGWSVWDPDKHTVRALNKALRDSQTNNENEFAIGSFSRNGVNPDPYFIWRGEGSPLNPFNQTYDQKAAALFKNTDDFYNLDEYSFEVSNTNTNYYDALNAMIDSSNYYSSNPNKNITVITYNTPDNINAFNADDIIAKAKMNNVKINIVVIRTVNWEMIRVALLTGGFVHVVSETFVPENEIGLYDYMAQAGPVMASFDRILSGNMHVMRVHLKLTKNSGNWPSGPVVYDSYETLERNSDGTIHVNNFIPFYVEIP